MSSAVPTIWRARTLLGRRLTSREDAPRHERREDRRGEHAELCLLQALAVEGEARDQQRDREPDARDGSAAGERWASSAPGAPRAGAGRVASHEAPRMPSGLPTT